MFKTPPTTPRPPRRLRFTLRLLLAGITVLCLALGWWTHRAREQRQAVKRIEMRGDVTHYDFPTRELPNGEYLHQSPLPAWLIGLLGNDFFHAVTEANIRDRTSLRELRSLPYLQTLIIKSNNVTDDDLAVLRSLPRLRMLWIHGEHHAQNRDTNLTQIGDRTLEVIAGLHDLEWASVHGKNFSSKAIEGFRAARELNHLEVGSFATDVTAEDFESLRNQGNVQHLDAWRLNPSLVQDYESIASW